MSNTANAEQPIRVLHFSSRYEECGVAKYLDHYIKGMVDAPHIKNEYFEVSPYETPNMSPTDLQNMAAKLQKTLKDYDVLHVQHEFGLYAHDSFRRVVEAGKKAGKKVVLTMHISPSMHGGSKEVRLHGLGPHSLVHYLREKRNQKNFFYTYVDPFRMADLLLVHNDVTADSLRRFGIPDERIKKIIHPVQAFETPPRTTRITEALNKKDGDVIYCTIGFIHRYKGLFEAVKALKYLPENYKLAILGGMKEDSDDVAIYDKLCDLISDWGLRDRVYITGFVKTDEELNSLIRECDICIYPYDRVYYAGVSSGSLNLAFANDMPVVTFPTATFKEIAAISDGATVLTETFAYYELAREIGRLDIAKQRQLSKAYAEKASWPNLSKELVKVYEEVAAQ